MTGKTKHKNNATNVNNKKRDKLFWDLLYISTYAKVGSADTHNVHNQKVSKYHGEQEQP